MLSLEDYITEAISSRKNSLEDVFEKTTDLDSFYVKLRKCGIMWTSFIDTSNKRKDKIREVVDRLSNWIPAYPVFDSTSTLNECHVIIISPLSKRSGCMYVFTWNFKRRYAEGPMHAKYYEEGKLVYDGVDKVLEKLNDEFVTKFDKDKKVIELHA